MLSKVSQMKKLPTFTDVLGEVQKHKRVSRSSLYLYFRKLSIKPVGEIRQAPQLYPPDTAKKILKGLGLCLCLCAGVASAQTSRFTTITAVSRTNNMIVTNSVEIPAGEAARVVSAHPVQWNFCSGGGATAPTIATYATLLKDGGEFEVFKDDVVEGPATIRIGAMLAPNQFPAVWLTIERLPQSFPPDRTLVLPQGSNSVAVALECSTNLVNWQTATNGLYGTPDAAKFFRIRAER